MALSFSNYVNTEDLLMSILSGDNPFQDYYEKVEEDKKGHFRSAEAGAGMTQKGVTAHRRENPGSKLKTAVTTPPSKMDPDSKSAKRRKSFCARSKSWNGERGKAARKRWNC